MTVEDLIAILGELPPKHQIVLSSDCIGSSYSLLDDVLEAAYHPDDDFQTEVSNVRGKKRNAVILLPTI